MRLDIGFYDDDLIFNYEIVLCDNLIFNGSMMTLMIWFWNVGFCTLMILGVILLKVFLRWCLLIGVVLLQFQLGQHG